MKPSDLGSSPRSVTYALSPLDDDGIKTVVASNVAAQDYSGAAINGALAVANVATNRLPQAVTVATGASGATYVTGAANPIVITGTGYDGLPLTENLLLTNAGGGETITSTKGFKTISRIQIPAQLGGGGTFKFGVSDIILEPPARELRHGIDGTINVWDQAGNADPLVGLNGEHHGLLVSRIVMAGTSFPLTVYV
jgi:hypothetical protein